MKNSWRPSGKDSGPLIMVWARMNRR